MMQSDCDESGTPQKRPAKNSMIMLPIAREMALVHVVPLILQHGDRERAHCDLREKLRAASGWPRRFDQQWTLLCGRPLVVVLN